jgi:hypothetical protein
VRRLRAGDWLALAATIGLAVTLALDWFSGPGGNQTGFDALPVIVLALVLLCIVLNLVLCALLAAGALDAFNLPPGVALCVVAPLMTLVLVLVTLMKPGDATGIEAAGWIGLACALLMTIGDFWSIKDERRDAPDRAVTPPPARPAPPA